MLESRILGVIYNQDSTGYEIKKTIENKIGMFYKASFGSLYPALKRLANKGYVKTYEKSEGATKNLVRIYFFDLLPQQIRDSLLLSYEEDNTMYLNNLLKLEVQLQSKVDLSEDYYKLCTLYYGVMITKKTLEWCKAMRENINFKDLIN